MVRNHLQRFSVMHEKLRETWLPLKGQQSVCNETTHIATSLIMTKHYCSYSSLTPVKQFQGTIISPIFQEMKASHRFLCHKPHLQSTVVTQAEMKKKYNTSLATKSNSRFGDTCHAKPSAFYGLYIRNN